MSDSEFRKNFWDERRRKAEGLDDSPSSAIEGQYKLNEDRKDLLAVLMRSQDWEEGSTDLAAPYTFAYCVQAGWVERRRSGGHAQYRITDEGIAVMNPFA